MATVCIPAAGRDDTFYGTVEDGHDNLDVELSQEKHTCLVGLGKAWISELAKTEVEIQTLRRVLGIKLRHVQELKRKLGVQVWEEKQSDPAEGFKIVKESTA